ncbi:hypothetical protein [Pseudonocardia acaciae]|uniref:hypothetical protein n=1 Tax=Pseudonocardia acaciae TaxID=551276 RepID=UPI0004920730|nr:hypothetical protein [Pseudonocardia acaciae]
MDQPTWTGHGSSPPPPDPVAVAIGNASLFGLGYVMLGRRWLAVLSVLVTAGLVTLLGTVARSLLLEIVVVLWWVALVVHGWRLAGGRPRPGAGAGVLGQRVIALAVTVPVLLAVGLVRFDAATIERTVTEAKQSGDCGKASEALAQVRTTHRVADAPLTARGDETTEACARLRTARDKLATALTGDMAALQAGFDGLAGVLADLPGHEKMVDVTLDGFLAGLPAKNPCHTAAVADWLRQRPPNHTVLDRAAQVVPATAPAALVGCGDDRMAGSDFETARSRYQQLLDQYPGHELTARAQEGVRRAVLAIELARVRSLLVAAPGGLPRYCSSPAQYSGAAPFAPGTNRALIYGTPEYLDRLPPDWRSTDAADAVLVVCVGEKEYGAAVQTCPYIRRTPGGTPKNVTFHKIAVPVKAYELRTGRLVKDMRVEIGGASCPGTIEYFGLIDADPPPDDYVAASDADLRAGFAPVITP